MNGDGDEPSAKQQCTGNHGAAMILDTRRCWYTLRYRPCLTKLTQTVRLWTIYQLDGNADPSLQESPPSNIVNGNSLEQYRSRSAVEALRDYIARFRSLEWIPGGLYDSTWTPPEVCSLPFPSCIVVRASPLHSHGLVPEADNSSVPGV